MVNTTRKTYTLIFKRTAASCIVLILILLVSVICAVTIGSSMIPVLDTLRILISSVPFISGWIDYSDMPAHYETIILVLRVPRVLLSVIVGTALAASGAVYQSLFRNPMADAFVIGIAPGASLGATLAIIFGFNSGISAFSAVTVFSFLGASAVSFFVYSSSRSKNGRVSVLTLILSGLAIGSLCNALSSFIKIVGRLEDLHKILFWLMGTFSTSDWSRVYVSMPVVLLSLGILLFFSKDLNLMVLGERRAEQLGVDVVRLKKILLLSSSLMVAVAVSVSGLIAFVGLIVPHIIRLLVGADNRILIPVSGLAGGILLLGADTLARVIIMPQEMPVGILTALLGSPFFIFLLRSAKIKTNGE